MEGGCATNLITCWTGWIEKMMSNSELRALSVLTYTYEWPCAP